MSRRLLLVLVGLGGGAAAVLLWSGTAYASSPRTLAVPRVAVAAADALPTARQQALPLPPLPTPPVPHVVRPVVDAVPPVVAHTLTRVRQGVPPVAAIVPAPPATAVARAARSSSVETRATPRRAVTAVRRTAHPASGAALASGSTKPARAPAHRAHRGTPGQFPLGVADGSGGPFRSGSGSPFAVTARADGRTPDAWSHAPVVVAREPASVSRRDIARPG